MDKKQKAKEKTKPTKAAKVQTAKPLTDLEKVLKVFKEDLDDSELQNRYDNMLRTAKSLTETYHSLTPEYNDILEKRNELNQIILSSAKLNIIDSNSIEKEKEFSKKLSEIAGKLDRLKTAIDNEVNLSKKYEELTAHKLFTFWKIIKVLDLNTLPLSDFQTVYKNRIF